TIKGQSVAQAHHIQAHGGDLQIDLDGLRRYASDALDDFEAFVDQLISRHDLDNQADAQRFLSVDVIPGEAIAERVLVAAEQSPQETRIRAVAYFRLSEDGVFRC